MTSGHATSSKLTHDEASEYIIAVIEWIATDDDEKIEKFWAKRRGWVVEAAIGGDWKPMAKILLDGGELTEIERQVISAKLLGRFPTPKGRRKNFALTYSIATKFWWLHEYDGLQVKATVTAIADDLGMGVSTVWRQLSNAHDSVIIATEAAERAAMVEIMPKKILKRFRALEENSQ